VDNVSYTWMGAPANAGAEVTQTGFEYTSTKSIFTMNAGGLVELNVTFLSPLYPKDQKRQSLVFSYLDVVVQSLDGKAHDVQLYADISAGAFAITPHYGRMSADQMIRMGCGRSFLSCAVGLRNIRKRCVPQGVPTRAALIQRDQPAS
jgi:hypothetical protein